MSKKKITPDQYGSRISSMVSEEDSHTKVLEEELNQLRAKNKELQKQKSIGRTIIPEKLEDIENEIKKLASTELIAVWLQGERLDVIKEKELFKEREYKSFTQYCVQYLEFTRQTAYNALFVYKQLDWDRVESMRADPTKIYLLRPLKENPDELNRVLAWIENELPNKQQVIEKVQSLKPTEVESSKSISENNEIKLKKNGDKFTIRFSAPELQSLDFSKEEVNQLQIQINSLIDNWVKQMRNKL